MALDKNFLAGVFDGVENADERVEKILKEYEADVTGLKVNRDEVLNEKKSLEEKYRQMESGSEALQASIKELEDKIKSSGNDATKQVYEVEKKKLQEMYSAQLSEKEARITKLDAENKSLYEKQYDYQLRTEFMRAIEGFSVNPKTLNDFMDLFLLRNKFKKVDLDGEERLLNDKFRNMKDAVSDYLTTDAGKAFLLQNNTGGGANGSGTSTRPGGSVITREQFESMSHTQRMDFVTKGGRIAS
jgi:hypothetical protein